MSALVSSGGGFDWIDEAEVAVLARVAGFDLASEELPAIADQFRRACDIVAPLLGCELDDGEEPGPVWRP